MLKIIFRIFLVLLGLILIGSFIRPPAASGVRVWGTTFSHIYAEELGFSWRAMYDAVLSELEPKALRIPIYWDEVEKEKGKYDFTIYDELITKAKEKDIKLILAIGKRVPRWPECHIPPWAGDFSGSEEKQALLSFLIEVVERYKNIPNLSYWQVENEPFLAFFGKCPPFDISFLDTEINTVRLLDPHHKILTTGSGELSLWLPAYKRGDAFGTTMYRTVWSEKFSPHIGYITYPLPPKFFWLRTNIARLVYGSKPIFTIELQAEPWGPGLLPELSLEEQEKSFSFENFKEHIVYASEVGFPETYLWGVEWWYFMKEKYNDPRFWNEAKTLFESSSK